MINENDDEKLISVVNAYDVTGFTISQMLDLAKQGLIPIYVSMQHFKERPLVGFSFSQENYEGEYYRKLHGDYAIITPYNMREVSLAGVTIRSFVGGINRDSDEYFFFLKEPQHANVENFYFYVKDLQALDTRHTHMPHTAGPWEARESYYEDGRYEIRTESCHTIGYAPLAYVKGDKRITNGDGYSNALLIAAAPCLLAACQHAIQYSGSIFKQDHHKILRDAIDKALGN